MDDYEEDDDEELVGSEESSKNWKGIVIALVVIAFILAMMVMAIALITEGKKKVDPGEDLSFNMLTDTLLLSGTATPPDFHFTKDGNSYVTVTQDKTGKFITHVNFSSDGSKHINELVPKSLFLTTLKNLTSASLSPDGHYLLLRLRSPNGNHSCLIYKTSANVFIDDSHFMEGTPIDYVSWIGDAHELLYIKENTILYKSTLEDSNPVTVSADPSTSGSPGSDNMIRLNGLPNQLYRELLSRDNMVWISPNSQFIAFARIKKRIPYPTTPSDTEWVVSMYVADPRSPDSKQELIADIEVNKSRIAYLKAVSWVDSERLMTVWLDTEQQVATHLLCNLTSSICNKNYEYHSSSIQLHWADVYQSPVFSEDLTEFYTILPNPENEFKLYKHIAAIKLNLSERKEPKVKFITKDSWSVNRIIYIREQLLFYTSTGANYTHRHLYRLNLTDSTTKCLSCRLNLDTECLYVDATFNKAADVVMLSCLGPDLPSYHVLPVEDLFRDTRLHFSHQVDMERHEAVSGALRGVKPPIVEYHTVALEDGFEASVKLYIPSILNRTEMYNYGLVIMVNDHLGEQKATQVYPNLFTTYLAKNQSYIVANVDLRGSGNRGEKLVQSVYGGLGVKEAYDLTHVVQYLKQDHFKVNESQIAVMGFGYGGFVALHTIKRSITTCAVAVAPLTDLVNLDTFSKQRYLGTGVDIPLHSDIVYRCDKGDDCLLPRQQNILVIHGMRDEIINYQNSLYIIRELQLAGYEFRQQIYPEVGHNITTSTVYKHFYQTVTNYLTECFSGSLQHNSLVDR